MKYSEEYIRYNLYNIIYSKRFKTQKDFAKYVGISPASVSLYVNGKNNPSTNALLTIAKKCNLSIDWFLTKIDKNKSFSCKPTKPETINNFMKNMKIIYMLSNAGDKKDFSNMLNTDISYSVICKWFTIESNPTIALICNLANARNIKPSMLFQDDFVESMVPIEENAISEKNIGCNIKNILTYRNANEYDISKKSGISFDTLTGCENEKHDLSLSVALILCRELNVSIKYLVYNPFVTIRDMFDPKISIEPTTTEDYSNFMTNLKCITKYSGLSTSSIARACDVSRNTVYSWINGRHLPSIYSVCTISKYLHMDISKLFERRQCGNE